VTDRKPYAPASRIQLREAFYATKPTAWTRYLRTSLPWQLVRFAVINLRMIRIIGLSHRGRG
jgi:hypothetical protein